MLTGLWLQLLLMEKTYFNWEKWAHKAQTPNGQRRAGKAEKNEAVSVGTGYAKKKEALFSQVIIAI